jgi:hypothetical protein
MNLPPGYKAPPAVQARLDLLGWIADNGGTAPRQIVALGPLFEGKDHDEALAVAGHLDALEREGLIQLQKTLGWGGWSCDVLSPGLDLIEQVRLRRDDPLRRRQAARDAFLRWLYDCTVDGDVSPNRDAFLQSEYGSYYGRPFTEQEVKAASEWLKDQGYITGVSAFGAGVVRPEITTKGENVVEFDRSVNADAQPPVAPYSVTTVNVTGSGNNVAANSSDVTQTTTVTMTDENARQLLGIAESLDQLAASTLLGLNQDRTREAALVVESLRETAKQDAAPGQEVRTLLDKVKEVALSGTGTAIGQTLVAAVDKVIQALGLG